MKLITRDTDYAVRALIYAARHKDKRICVREVVKELKIPRPFLRKIIQILNKNGIVLSCKGKGGGFSLVNKPDNIFLVDLIKIFQGPLKLNECLFRNKICPSKKTCVLNKKIDTIEQYVFDKLEPITIASLIQ